MHGKFFTDCATHPGLRAMVQTLTVFQVLPGILYDIGAIPDASLLLSVRMVKTKK